MIFTGQVNDRDMLIVGHPRVRQLEHPGRRQMA